MWPGTPILKEMNTSIDRDRNMKNENRIIEHFVNKSQMNFLLNGLFGIF